MTVKEVWEKFKSLDEMDQKTLFAYLKGYLGDDSFYKIMGEYFELCEETK